MNKCLIYGNGNGVEALYRVFMKLGIYTETKRSEDIFQVKYNGNCIDIGHLRKMEYMPEHYFTHKKIKDKSAFLGLILGLSYGRDAIREDMIDVSVLNASTSGQDLFYDSCVLREVTQRKKIKFIIQTIAPYSLRYDESLSATKKKEVGFYYTRYKTLHNNKILIEDAEEYDRQRRIFNDTFKGLTDWESVSKMMWEDYLEHNLYDIRSKQECKSFIEEMVSCSELDMIKRQYNKPFQKTIEENKVIIRQMYELESKTTKVLFFFPPFTKFYKEWWNENYYKETLDYIKNIAVGIHADVLDMTKEKMDNSYFRDSGHVNRKGAEIVANRINNWIAANDFKD